MVFDRDAAAGEDQDNRTIDAVARYSESNLVASIFNRVTVNKSMGRVGDAPTVRAFYTDNGTCAVSVTGYREDFMCSEIAKTIADALYFKGGDAETAIAEGLHDLRHKVTGRGEVIFIDREGKCASGFITKKIIHGWVQNDRETVCRL